ncbi:MAG TPA: hypothetical protein VGV61_08080 [Thermoanaerobaculia bacterium]|jgi:hypothetical protein|nr:hypothetical protein [Thermoanaerobaculia bacterium]
MRFLLALLVTWLSAALAASAVATAQEQPPPAPPEPAAAAPAREPFEPLFLGYQTEPAMDYGGRVVVSAHDALSHAFGRLGNVAEDHPGLAPVWEFPLGAGLLLVQHEVLGHGGRGREFGLGPSYSFGFFAAATGTKRAPEDHEQLALLAAGGVEADGVLGHRLLLDALREEGVDGSRLPLAMMAKLDLTLYVSSAPRPRPGDDKGGFTHEYRHGNDMVLYLVGRQASRFGAPAEAVWNGDYEPDFDERLLHDSWHDARVAAAWNLLDPSLAAAMVAYFRQHLLHGETRVHAPALRLGQSARLTVGTRAALGPQEISRFLDVDVAFPWAVVDVYLRDLDSSVDRTYGYGAALHQLRLGPVALSLAGDVWDVPRATEGLEPSSGWNASVEAEAMLGRFGVALKVGKKSDGFFPGLPRDAGTYAGAGVLAIW